jgi:PAS domain S-box-containing protein
MVAFASMFIGVLLAILAFRGARAAEQARRDTEQRFKLLVDGVSDHAIYLLDTGGHVNNWNSGAQRLKGYSADEIIGQHFSRFYTEEDRASGLPVRALDTALREGKFEAEGWRMRKDGSRFLASVVISAIRDGDGRHFGFAKVTRDVTEQRLQQQALEQAQAALAQSQKMEALGQLSGGIAHDFNNLLGVIKNCVEIMQRRIGTNGTGDADVEQQKFLDMIRRSTDRAVSLTQRMLAFSRRQPLAPKSVNLNSMITGMRDLLRQALNESISLEVVAGGGTWLVSVDPNQLETAVLNLVVNARDAMPDGGRLTIETSNTYLDQDYSQAHEAVQAGQYGMIAVSDTGTGMPPEVAARAFEPFFTTKDADKGTGLGLSQVYGFVKQSGGHVKIVSEPGQGTSIKLYLPRAALSEEAYVPQGAIAPKAGYNSATILLVEDETDLRNSTAEQLRELGYRVSLAADGQQALALLEEGCKIDLLFTDVGLPHSMNGRQLAAEAQRRQRGLKVLYTTGYARDAIVHHGRLDPGVNLILKPYTQAQLAEMIRQVLA